MTSMRIKSLVQNIVEKSSGASLPFIALEDIESGTGRLLIDSPPLKEDDGSIVHRDGDVLFSKLRPYLAKSLLSTTTGSATGELLVLRPGPRIDQRFLFYITLSLPWIEWANATAYGTKMPRTSWELLGEYRIVVPSLEEQYRIADFLDAEIARMEAIEETERRIERTLLERREAGVFSLVTGARNTSQRNASLAWSNTIPENWNVVRLNLVAKMGSGHTPSRSRPDWWENPTIPWITTGEVRQVRDDRLETIVETREKISELGLANSAAELHPAGTVVLCRTASAGYSAVMGADMATSQDFVTWTCGPRLDPYYLLWCLRAMRQDLLGRLAMGSTHKTIYVPDLQMLRIPLPSIGEQRDIVNEIRRQNQKIDRLLDAVRRQLELLAERRQALITAAVTGQFDVSTASGRGVGV